MIAMTQMKINNYVLFEGHWACKVPETWMFYPGQLAVFDTDDDGLIVARVMAVQSVEDGGLSDRYMREYYKGRFGDIVGYVKPVEWPAPEPSEEEKGLDYTE